MRQLHTTAGVGLSVSLCFAILAAASGAEPPVKRPLTVVVLDPLAAPLACPCVQGYAQRKYEKLGEYLEKRLERRVQVVFAEALSRAIRGEAKGRADLIIGKQSLVKADAAELRLPIRPLAMLTGQDGSTTLTGLFVVPALDPAQRVADLKGYRILFGKTDADEKHSAALAALRAAGVEVPKEPETREGCSDAAAEILEKKERPRERPEAAVISSYAIALLEGCGTIDKGALRVIGKTEPVPFVTAFASAMVAPDDEKQITSALLAVRDDPKLLAALETKAGFVGMPARSDPEPGRAGPKGNRQDGGATNNRQDAGSTDWPGWRGPRRDGVVASLPEKLPEKPKILWQKELTGAGLAGVAATKEVVIVVDRDPLDLSDIFRCLQADTGVQLWQLEYPAVGKLDYGNSPRATPLIHQGKVYLLGAFGDLHCVNLADGSVVWKKNLTRDFAAELPKWGYCASPLVVDEKLIVNPGAKEASLVALDCRTGKVAWQTPGLPAAYASFIVGRFGGRTQIVGYDAISLGGWDPQSGKRLWTLLPEEKGDFNVPTPIDVGGKLLVSSENNGTRLYEFDATGAIVSKPVASFRDLAPDSSTPVVIDGRVFGCDHELYCLDLSNGLKPLWAGKDRVYGDYASFIASRDRVLVTTSQGELLLVSATATQYTLISRQRVCDAGAEVLSHPALVGDRLYVRDGTSVRCVSLSDD
jgi:outer membrane protein assembly factor BamB/ABC-type phosphate/phosphonate transport system substrate-binding protein